MTQPIVILVSLNFPPSQVASVHRARHLATHLPALGWRPIVVTVDERYHKEPIDPKLGELVPPTIEVHRIGAVPLILTQPFGIGDLSLRSLLAVRGQILELIGSERPSAFFITGWPFYQMLLSVEIMGRGVPVVLDFQDPWVSSYGAKQLTWSKAGLTHRLAEYLEPKALRGASYITSVSETQNKQMADRYPWLERSRMAAIPIGGDPEDFKHLRRTNVVLPPDVLDPNRTNFSYVGTFMPRSGPLVRLMLLGLGKLRRENPEVGARIRFNFIGTSNQPNDRTSMQVLPIAREVGVVDAVSELPQRLPFMQALAVLDRTECILLIGSDEPHYTASKIYPALLSGRPFLSLFHCASSSHAILSAAGGGFTHTFGDGRREEEVVADLAASMWRLVVEPERLGRADPAAYAPFEARAVARRYADIFELVSIRKC
jgi:Glycosyl transferase 4-like domain